MKIILILIKLIQTNPSFRSMSWLVSQIHSKFDLPSTHSCLLKPPKMCSPTQICTKNRLDLYQRISNKILGDNLVNSICILHSLPLPKHTKYHLNLHHVIAQIRCTLISLLHSRRCHRSAIALFYRILDSYLGKLDRKKVHFILNKSIRKLQLLYSDFLNLDSHH